MNKISTQLLGTTIAVGLALTGGALAADLPMKAAPAVAPAPAPAGAYVSVFGGWAAGMTATGDYLTGDAATFTLPFDSGYVIGGAIGTHLMPNLRGEVELSYVHHDVGNTITGTVGVSSDQFTATGTGSTLYALGNLWYDIDTGSNFTPYLGGGIGAAVLMPDLSYIDGPTRTFDTNSVALAAQLGAGIQFKLADNISIDLGYRAKGVFNASLTGTGTSGNLGSLHYVDQTVQAGLTFGF